jgi:MFS superfamily sulfate permease-like transporter
VGPGAIDTVLAMIAATSLATGAVFLLMGYFSLGDIARFVPFPVVGGILAGTGYLILAGSIGILGVGSLRDLTTGAAQGLSPVSIERHSWLPRRHPDGRC